jgi:hypothetical protein
MNEFGTKSHRDYAVATRSARLRFFGWVALLVVFMVLPATGCVRRRLNVRTNPPGALVYVDNQQIGTTPCSVDFTYYGTREIRLVKPGYETLTVNQPIPAPWYELPPLDFVSENVVPSEIQDYRTVTYNLAPQVIKPTDQLLADAEQLRAASQQGAVLPAAAAAPIGPPLVGPPTMAPQIGAPVPGPVLTAPTLGQESVSPGILVPTTPGAGVLPPGGTPLEPLPAPR